MEEIKRCPFCGGKAKFLVSTTSLCGAKRGYEFGIRCSQCGTSTPIDNYKMEFRMKDDGDIEIITDGREAAIEAWNKRYKED